MLELIMVMVGSGLIGAAIGGFIHYVRDRKNHTHNEVKTKSELFGLPKTDTRDTPPEIMVKLIPAANGRLLEISTKKVFPGNNGGHWEWEHEMFIVEEGQTLSQAIAMVMLMKGLEK